MVLIKIRSMIAKRKAPLASEVEFDPVVIRDALALSHLVQKQLQLTLLEFELLMIIYASPVPLTYREVCKSIHHTTNKQVMRSLTNLVDNSFLKQMDEPGHVYVVKQSVKHRIESIHKSHGF